MDIERKLEESMNVKREIFIALVAAFALSCAGAFAHEASYKIGDKGPGGGIVFYCSEAGFPVRDSDGASPVICHYLECSPVELEDLTWCTCGEDEWRDENTADGPGAGKLNTAHIVNDEHEKPLTPSNCAAYACAEYSTKTTKRGEWYLPSKFELNLIYENLRKSGKIVSSRWHWSSSQNLYYDGVWCQKFADGSQTRDYEYGIHCARAVRAF